MLLTCSFFLFENLFRNFHRVLRRVQVLRCCSSKVEIFAGSNSIQVRPLISGCWFGGLFKIGISVRKAILARGLIPFRFFFKVVMRRRAKEKKIDTLS